MNSSIEKRLQSLVDRLLYIKDIFANKHQEKVELLQEKLEQFQARLSNNICENSQSEMATLEELFTFIERKLDDELTAMDKVRIVRNPQRMCLRDILENVYDNFTEIGGQDEYSIDPSMLIARAIITRRRGKKTYNHN